MKSDFNAVLGTLLILIKVEDKIQRTNLQICGRHESRARQQLVKEPSQSSLRMGIEQNASEH